MAESTRTLGFLKHSPLALEMRGPRGAENGGPGHVAGAGAGQAWVSARSPGHCGDRGVRLRSSHTSCPAVSKSRRSLIHFSPSPCCPPASLTWVAAMAFPVGSHSHPGPWRVRPLHGRHCDPCKQVTAHPSPARTFQQLLTALRTKPQVLLRLYSPTDSCSR